MASSSSNFNSNLNDSHLAATPNTDIAQSNSNINDSHLAAHPNTDIANINDSHSAAHPTTDPPNINDSNSAAHPNPDLALELHPELQKALDHVLTTRNTGNIPPNIILTKLMKEYNVATLFQMVKDRKQQPLIRTIHSIINGIQNDVENNQQTKPNYHYKEKLEEMVKHHIDEIAATFQTVHNVEFWMNELEFYFDIKSLNQMITDLTIRRRIKNKLMWLINEEMHDGPYQPQAKPNHANTTNHRTHLSAIVKMLLHEYESKNRDFAYESSDIGFWMREMEVLFDEESIIAMVSEQRGGPHRLQLEKELNHLFTVKGYKPKHKQNMQHTSHQNTGNDEVKSRNSDNDESNQITDIDRRLCRETITLWHGTHGPLHLDDLLSAIENQCSTKALHQKLQALRDGDPVPLQTLYNSCLWSVSEASSRHSVDLSLEPQEDDVGQTVCYPCTQQSQIRTKYIIFSGLVKIY